MASSSSPRCYKYDVFLSFRGEDTRKTFVSHLHNELLRKGITTFKDDKKLECGDSVSNQLPIAIQESRLSIVVISENYASSHWCLDELEMIMECKKKGQLTVIPIFYEVDPSDVRNQKGTFEDAFKSYEDSNMARKVQTWKAALTEIANITGVDSRIWKDEAKMIQKLVNDVSDKLLNYLSTENKGLVGMETHMETILPLLLKKSSDCETCMIGIWGMGGIGKTTIAEHLYKRMLPRFQSHCFINVKEILRIHSLTGLQEQFLSKILAKDDIKLWGVEHGYETINTRLQYLKVLVVLDDVDKSNQLDALAKETSWFGPGSVVIITTRDKHLLVAHAVELVYEVKYLSKDDALHLFEQFAFKRELPIHDFQRLSIRATKHAQGLPLALKVFGSFLCGRSKEKWESALRRLERTPAPDIMDVLKVSYDGLDERNKDIFLHVSCLFNWVHVNLLTKLIDGDESDINLAIEVLAEKSLIQISADGYVTVHELLLQMGKQLVCQQSINEPGKRKFLLDSQEIYNVLTKSTGTKTVEGISLNISEIKEMFVSDKAFNRMQNLKFLCFYMHSYTKKDMVRLQAGKSYFYCRLRLLYWPTYPLKNLRFCPEHLVELNMPNSNLEKLWKGIPKLGSLKRINLRHSINLKEVPNLSKATNLENLDLSHCKSLVELPLCIQSLNKLTDLHMWGCTKLKHIPSNINLKALEYLYLGGCSRLKKFPEISRNIKRLYLRGTAIEEVPDSVEHLSVLVELSMSNCKRLRNFPKTTQKLKSLETLHIRGSRYMTGFPHLPENIKRLWLCETVIEEVPSCIKHLTKLEELYLIHCKKLQSFPELPLGLRRLAARGCASLERTSQVLKLSLETLSLQNCFKMDLDAQSLAQHMISFPCKEGKSRTAFVSGSNMPTCFNHRARGPSLTIRLPQSRSILAFERFVGCFVVPFEDNNRFIGQFVFRCHLRDTRSGKVYDVSPSIQSQNLESDLLILCSRDIQLKEDATFDELTMELLPRRFLGSPSSPLKVKECGVRLLFKQDVKEEYERAKMMLSHFYQDHSEAMCSGKPVGIEDAVNTGSGDGDDDDEQQEPNCECVNFFEYISSKTCETIQLVSSCFMS